MRRPQIFTSLVNRCWSLFQWGLFLAVAAALLLCGYLYLRLDDEIRRQVEHTLASHYPHFQVQVGKARLEKGRGIAVGDLSVRERSGGGVPQPLLSVDELFLVCDTRVEGLMSGKPRLERIVVRRPRLRAVRHADGHWNIEGLLPLPRLSIQTPVLEIEAATLILEDATHHEVAPLAIRDIDLTLRPVHDPSPSASGNAARIRQAHHEPVEGRVAASRQFHVIGKATGSPARELTFEGTIGFDDGLLDLAVVIRSLEVSPELMAAVPLRLPAPLDLVELYGSLDATVHWCRTMGGGPLDWSADVSLNRGRLDHSALPLPLTDLGLKLHADSSRLVVQQLTGRMGTADIVLACERHGWRAGAPLGLAVRVVGLMLDADFEAALPAEFGRLWRRFQPAGNVDAEVQLTYDGRQWRPMLTAHCRGISLTDSERFPYPLDQTTGTLALTRSPTGDGLLLQMDLAANGSGQPVQIKAELDRIRLPVARRNDASAAAQITGSLDHKPTGWIEVAGSGVVIHEQLLVALPDQAEPFVRSLTPEGTIDFRWRSEWTDPQQPHADSMLEFKLSNCAIRYDRFPYPLRHIHGRVAARNGQWTLEDLEARDRQGSAVVTCRGVVQSAATGGNLELVFHGTNVPLDDNLKDALSPQVQRLWTELRPQGRLDFTAHVQRPPGQLQPVIDVELRPHERTVSIHPTFFPYRLEQLDGRAIVTPGRVELRQVRAQHGRSTFATQGTWQATPNGGWQLALDELSADRLSFESDLRTALPPGAQKVVEKLRPSGNFDLHHSSLSFVKRPDTAELAATWDVQVTCHQAALRGELPLENLSGGVRLLGQSDGADCSSYGELSVDSLVWNDVQLTNLRGPFWTDSAVCLLGRHATDRLAQPPLRLTADAYGGTLAADIQLQHGANPRYHAEISLGGAQLGRIASERLGGPHDLTGSVSGKLTLAGAGRSTYAMNGAGELHVVDANIYKLPVLVALLKVLRSRSPDTTAFNRCDMQFDVYGEHVHFRQLDLLGDAVSLFGRGETNFDREVRLEFYSLVGPGGLTVPFLSDVVGQASRQILQLKVDGTLDNPQIHREAFPAVGQMLKEIRTEAQQSASAVAAPAAAGIPWPNPRR